MSSILVTGGSGFVGTALCRRLVETGERPWSLSRRPSPWLATRSLLGDVTDPAAARAAFERSQPETVFHVAGGRMADDEQTRRLNLVGTLNVLSAAAAMPRRPRIVVVGSAAEYGVVDARRQPIAEREECAPVTPYGLAKLAATRAAIRAVSTEGLDTVVVRLFNVIGAGVPQGQLVGDLVARLRRLSGEDCGVLETGPLSAARDFLALDDAVEGLMRAAAHGGTGQIYNVCSGQPTVVRQIAERLVALAGGDIALQEVRDPERSTDVSLSYGSHEKATRELGFVPRTTLQSALASAWAASDPDTT